MMSAETAGSRAATPPTSRPKTRERILDACRALFNERGPDSVTTAEIARSVSINEGNLYYHFKRKEDVLEALFERFSAELLQTAAPSGADGEGVERHRSYLDGWFKIMWEWRFFYRDGAAVFRLAPALRPRLRAVSEEGLALTRQAVRAMEQDGLILIEPGALDRVLTNSWIVATYWIDHLRSHRGIEKPGREDIGEGAAQVLSLFAPYLTRDGMQLTEPSRQREANEVL